LNFGERRGARQHDGEDVQLAYAPRNQLRILRAKIENYDCLGVHSLVWQGPRRDVKTAGQWASLKGTGVEGYGLQPVRRATTMIPGLTGCGKTHIGANSAAL
jgi:hypothetical protein